MAIQIAYSLMITLACGFLLAVIATSMASDMESAILAGFPGALIGIYVGLACAIRAGQIDLPRLGIICLACAVVGAAAGCLSTVRKDTRLVGLSGTLFGLLGGSVIFPASGFGLLAGAIGGGLFGLLNSRRPL